SRAPMSRDVARKLLEHVRRSDSPMEDDPRAASLTPRERAVLDAFARGLRYEEVAASLNVSVNTVRSHVRSIYDRRTSTCFGRPCRSALATDSARPAAPGAAPPPRARRRSRPSPRT